MKWIYHLHSNLFILIRQKAMDDFKEGKIHLHSNLFILILNGEIQARVKSLFTF